MTNDCDNVGTTTFKSGRDNMGAFTLDCTRGNTRTTVPGGSRGDVETAILAGVRSAMAKVPLRSIKVTALCRSCGINRTTFYDHFQDVYAAAQRLENDLISELARSCDAVRGAEMGSYEICLRFLEFFDARRDTVSALLANETAGRFMARLDDAMQRLFHHQLARRYDISRINSTELDDLLAFVSAGFYHFYLKPESSPNSIGSKMSLERRARLIATYCDAGVAAAIEAGKALGS